MKRLTHARGRIGDDVHRADPGAERPAAGDDVDRKHDGGANHHRHLRRMSRKELLHEGKRVGKRNGSGKKARGEVARQKGLSQNRPAQPGRADEKRENRKLHHAPHAGKNEEPAGGVDGALSCTGVH